MRRAVLALLLSALPLSAADPDPATVRRYGPAYRYPQAGWTVLHVEGEPFDRGYQHGRLMAAEIGEYLAALARQASERSPADGWRQTRTLVSGLFLRKFDREYLDEMRGIADGAAAAGATFDGRPVDTLDVCAMNVSSEYDSLDAALEATPTLLEGRLFPRPPGPRCCPPEQKDHCSAFAATGPATRDGKIVFGHITMWTLHSTAWYNVWLDVKPASGHRVLMQSFPGGIWSGMDYYQSSSGLMLTETTIRQTKFDPDGVPLTNRVRKAMQYANTIDELVKELVTKNNGLYANEWLIGDANTNEVAALELGTTAHRLRRSSKSEWQLAGVEGFYWGCNNTKDLAVRLDTLSSATGRPQDVSWRPSDRDRTWLKLYQQHRGKIDAGFGRLAFTTPPLAAAHSLDAKVTTTDMTKRLESLALFGPPLGEVWQPTFDERTNRPEVRPLVPNDWTTLAPAAPAAAEPVTAADVSDRVGGADAAADHDPPTAPAWTGTLLPKADADVWLTAGFAGYERYVALEQALRGAHDGKLTPADRKRLELALFRHRSDYLSAKANEPATRDPSPLVRELDRGRWHREQTGYGVCLLHYLRGFIGSDAFDTAMLAFGREHAGREVTADAFVAFLGRATNKDTAGFVRGWAEKPDVGGPAFAVLAFLDAPEETLIVYGTRADAAANKVAALDLQRRVRERWSNVTVPVKPDTDVDEEAFKGRHVVCVGRPETNVAAQRVHLGLPVEFGPRSCRVGDTVYAHERTAVAAARANPFDKRYSVVVLGGLSADATYRAVQDLMARGTPPAPVLVLRPTGVTPLLVPEPGAKTAAR